MKRFLVFLILTAYAGLVLAGSWSISGGFLYSDNAYRDTKANRLVIPFYRKLNQHFYEVTPAEAMVSGFSAFCQYFCKCETGR